MKKRKQDHEREKKAEASRTAEYWVRVMNRLHRMQSRQNDRDPRIQALMRNHQDPLPP